MRKLQRVVLPILILGGLIIFTVENWSPSVPLVLFGAKTIALPLALWVIVACLSGALTTVAIALCLRLLTRDNNRSSSKEFRTASDPPPRGTPRNNEPTRSASRFGRSQFDDDTVDRRSSSPRKQPKHSSPQTFVQTPPSQSPSREPAVDVGAEEDWEEFSRPREEWEDWQRSTPLVTEVDADQPISSGSRFKTTPQDSSRSQNTASAPTKSSADYAYSGDRSVDEGVYSTESRSQEDRTDRYSSDDYRQDDYRRDRYVGDDYAQSTYDRQDYDAEGYEPRGYGRDDYARDDYGYSPSDDAPSDYGPNAYASHDYGQAPYPQDRYAYPNERQDEYTDAAYGGDRYNQDRYEYDQPYAGDDYGAEYQYGPDREYGQGDGAPPNQSSEQYIMDYGDEAALDAFDAELEARAKNNAKTDQTSTNPSRSGRYRWKNPFNTQKERDNAPQQDDDLDLSILDDWEE